MTTPTPPRDLSERDAHGIAGTIHECDPAAVERLRAYLAQQQPPRWQEAARRQYNGPRIVANIQRAAAAVNARRTFVLSDEQMTDVEQRRAAGQSWERIAATFGRSHTTLMNAVTRYKAARKVQR